jgi:hypothetical protein
LGEGSVEDLSGLAIDEGEAVVACHADEVAICNVEGFEVGGREVGLCTVGLVR